MGATPDSSLCVSDHGDTPNLDPKRASNDTYLYQSRSASGAIPGVDQYQLIRFNAAGLDAS